MGNRSAWKDQTTTKKETKTWLLIVNVYLMTINQSI